MPSDSYEDFSEVLAKTLSPHVNSMAESLIAFKERIDKEHPEQWQYYEKVFIHCSHAFNIMVDYFSQLSYIQYNVKRIIEENEKSIEKEVGTDSKS